MAVERAGREAEAANTLHGLGRDALKEGNGMRAAQRFVAAADQYLAAADMLATDVKAATLRLGYIDIALQTYGEALRLDAGRALEIRRGCARVRAFLAAREADAAEAARPEYRELFAAVKALEAKLPAEVENPPEGRPDGPGPVVEDGVAVEPQPDANPLRAARPRVAPGLAAGLGVSLGLVGASTVLMLVAGKRMNDSHDAALAVAGATMRPFVEGDDFCDEAVWEARPGGGSFDDVAGDCRSHGRWRGATISGATVLAASAISAVVFAALIGRAGRRFAATRRLAGAYFMPLGVGALVGGGWRF